VLLWRVIIVWQWHTVRAGLLHFLNLLSLPIPSFSSFVHSFFCRVYRLVSASSLGNKEKVMAAQGKGGSCTGRVWSEKDRKGNMISWLPWTVLHSWQAVDILRLDNQTANVSSCLSLLFNRHLLISFALSCLFADLLAACLQFCLVLQPQKLKSYLKNSFPPIIFLPLSPTFWNFYYLYPFFLKWWWYWNYLFSPCTCNDTKVVNYKQVLILTYTDN